MERKERLLKVRSELQDFEKCLEEAQGNISLAFDRWLESYRLLGVAEAIGYWVNMGWTEDQVREELKSMYQLIDEELRKMKTEEV
jgi:hypothetical protein